MDVTSKRGFRYLIQKKNMFPQRRRAAMWQGQSLVQLRTLDTTLCRCVLAPGEVAFIRFNSTT